MLSITLAFPIPVINIVLRRKDWSKKFQETFIAVLYIYNSTTEMKFAENKTITIFQYFVLRIAVQELQFS